MRECLQKTLFRAIVCVRTELHHGCTNNRLPGIASCRRRAAGPPSLLLIICLEEGDSSPRPAKQQANQATSTPYSTSLRLTAMVSPLSARLLGSSTEAATSSTGGLPRAATAKKNIRESVKMMTARAKSKAPPLAVNGRQAADPAIGGYVADIELSLGTASVSNSSVSSKKRQSYMIDLPFESAPKRKPMGAKSDDTFPGRADSRLHKRMKVQEMNFAAKSAKSDLARGGLPVPKVRVDCPRTLPWMSGVDMSKVTLKHSLSCDDYPTGLSLKPEELLRAMAGLASKFQCSYTLPTTPTGTDAKSLDDASSTSSVTDPDSEAVDDSEGAEEGKSYDGSSMPTSMGDALSICSRARYVIRFWSLLRRTASSSHTVSASSYSRHLHTHLCT